MYNQDRGDKQMVDYYERIKNTREDLDYKQYQLAKDLELNSSTYSLYENGFRSIPLVILDKIAQKLNTSIDYLVENTDVKRYKNSKEMNYDILLKNIKKYRKLNNLKQNDVAKIMNCTRQAWGNYEQGIRPIPIDKLIDFSKLVNKSIDFLADKIDYEPQIKK